MAQITFGKKYPIPYLLQILLSFSLHLSFLLCPKLLSKSSLGRFSFLQDGNSEI